jgi:hypothetical protein
VEIKVTRITEAVLLSEEDYRTLALVRERALIKLRQLIVGPEEQGNFKEFGGLGTGDDIHNRDAYVRILKWLLS